MSTTHTTPAPAFTSVRSASQRLGLSIEEVYDIVKAGELKYVQRAKGFKINILAADIDRWIAENAIAKREDVA